LLFFSKNLLLFLFKIINNAIAGIANNPEKMKKFIQPKILA
jgi:hypothetical protein